MASETSASSTKKSSASSRKRPTKASRGEGAPRSAAKPPARAAQVATAATRELAELTGREAEAVTSLERTDEGWLVQVEVLELHRVPETTDVLALYEVETDRHGALQGYRRVRRYVRGVPADD